MDRNPLAEALAAAALAGPLTGGGLVERWAEALGKKPRWLGSLAELDTVAERLGVTLTEDVDEALQSTANKADAPPDGKAAANATTANTKAARRLRELVEEALRTHNSADEARDDHGRWVADPSAGVVTPNEARGQLRAGIDTKDVFGKPTRFDEQVIEHWEANQHPLAEQDRRLRRLPDAVKTVETPHEVWQGDKQTIHLRAFVDDKSKRRYMAGMIMENGRARTFFHETRKNAINKLRKGVRLYVRP